MSEGGGNTVDQRGETTMIRIPCCWIRAAAIVISRSAKPHQVPSACHPSFLHTRRMRSRLTTGMTMPIDFSASVVHKVQRLITEGQIIDSPSTASVVASAENCTGESSHRRTPCKGISESGNADMDRLLGCLELRATRLNAWRSSGEPLTKHGP